MAALNIFKYQNHSESEKIKQQSAQIEKEMNATKISIQKLLARVRKYEQKRSKFYFKLHKRARKLSYNMP